jgi:hypothetical protein
MRDWKRRTVVSAAALALIAFGVSREAAAHPRGHGGVAVYGGGFYGWGPWYGYGPYWGWGWGPYYPGFYPPGGVDMNAAMIAGFGAVELNVKPNRADVWADGRYVGEARDLDGYPSYLWLPDGPHRLQVYKGGYKVFDDQIDVRRGTRVEIKLKLEPGESEPPGLKPGVKAPEQKEDKPKGEKPKDDTPKGEEAATE